MVDVTLKQPLNKVKSFIWYQSISHIRLLNIGCQVPIVTFALRRTV